MTYGAQTLEGPPDLYDKLATKYGVPRYAVKTLLFDARYGTATYTPAELEIILAQRLRRIRRRLPESQEAK